MNDLRFAVAASLFGNDQSSSRWTWKPTFDLEFPLAFAFGFTHAPYKLRVDGHRKDHDQSDRHDRHDPHQRIDPVERSNAEACTKRSRFEARQATHRLWHPVPIVRFWRPEDTIK